MLSRILQNMFFTSFLLMFFMVPFFLLMFFFLGFSLLYFFFVFCFFFFIGQLIAEYDTLEVTLSLTGIYKTF